MKRFVLIVFAAFASTACSKHETLSTSAPDAGSATDDLLSDTFSALSRREPLASWKLRHPTISCEPNSVTQTAASDRHRWCFRCVQPSPLGDRHWLFYALQLGATDCELGAFEVEQQGDDAALTKARDALAKQLTDVVGPGTTLSGCTEDDWGCAYFRDATTWQKDKVRAVVATVIPDADARKRMSPHVSLFATSPALSAKLKERYTAATAELFVGMPEFYEVHPAEVAAGQLIGSYPALADPPIRENQRRALISKLLSDAARTKNLERRGALFFAADSLATGLLDTDGKKVGELHQETIKGQKLSWDWAPPWPGWHHQHDLIWSLLVTQPQTRWGGQAFLFLQHAAWSRKLSCRERRAVYPEVIQRSDEFLALHPNHPLGRIIKAELAEALETKWSLSHPAKDVPEEERVSPEEGASARQRAVAIYRELLDGKDDTAEMASRRLPMLELNCDSGSRAFFCAHLN